MKAVQLLFLAFLTQLASAQSNGTASAQSNSTTTAEELALAAPDTASNVTELDCVYRRNCIPDQDLDSTDAFVGEYPNITSVADAKRHIIRPPRNKAMFWSGVPFTTSQDFAKAHGLKTLELSVPSEILYHPNQRRGNPNRAQFWDWFSQAFSEVLVEDGHSEVAVTLSAASWLIDPAKPNPFNDGRMVKRSDWAEIEFPIMQRNKIEVIAWHPLELGNNANSSYELWPTDRGRTWQSEHGAGTQHISHTCPGLVNGFRYRCVNRLALGNYKVACDNVIGFNSYRVKLREDQEAGGQCIFTIQKHTPTQSGVTFEISNARTSGGIDLQITCPDLKEEVCVRN